MENFLSPTYVELYTRLIVALLLGMLIGTERLIAHKTAGMRTFSLVSMGASLFVIIATLIAQQYAPASFNGAYIPAAIITGVGFIGSGLMTWKHSQLLGITSAAGLWISAGIGIACGFGFYQIAIVACTLVLFIFIVLWFIEQQIKRVIGYADDPSSE